MVLMPNFMPNKVDDSVDSLFLPFKGKKFERIKCDIYEKDGSYIIEMDIPGYDKKDIHVQIDKHNYLTVTVSHDSSKDVKRNYIYRERSSDRYERSFYLPGVDSNNIQASYENGVLKIIVTKSDDKELFHHTIEIK